MTFLLGSSITFAYGDGDDPLCTYGCLMSSSAEITEIRAYTHVGDLVVAVDTGFDECPEGGFVESNSDNRAELTSLLLSAFHASTQVKLQVYRSNEWGATSGKTHCMIRAVRLYQ
ncbi:hypothetical protein [Microbulbifer sp. VAAF005]|uniref:hypothetical protein n=1 Tax=Microbulbifer sp. VAAF005 TaxID=3034230 RepID=UPI0024ADD3BB|nr:hypothetical protein [Microbulbifer sp. VAAF005]WHI47628.1 hypothetical protein P0078_04350 [Microbulbifer sp. VAAF005]